MPLDGSGGFLLSLLTESFAVRALIGSLAAAGLALCVVRPKLVHNRTARRVVVLAPVLVAVGAAIAVARAGGSYLPQLWVTSGSGGAAGQLIQLLGELRAVSPTVGINLLVLAYAVITATLVVRRVAGARRLARLLASAREPVGYGRVVPPLQRLSRQMDVAVPTLKVLDNCPGGAFTAGLRKPVIVIDPVLLDRLDEHELQALLAHELAHIARRDNAIGLAVGIVRDFAFFLPPVHLAQRWLRCEQEESADELASEHTGRPGALASSILKVWDRHQERGSGWRPQLACAAIGTASATRPAASATSPAMQALTSRMERLIERGGRAHSRRRTRVEISLAVLLLVAGGLAAWLVPAWIARDLNAYSLSFVYLTAPPAVQVEAPAMATFRALTADAPSAARYLPGPSARPAKRLARDPASCPCVESIAQLRQGETFEAAPQPPRMLWRAAGHDAWEIANLRERAALESRPLLALTDRGPRVGFFVLARTPGR